MSDLSRLLEEDPMMENVRASARRYGVFAPPPQPEPKAELRETPKAYPGQRDQFIQHATKYVGPNATAEGAYGMGHGLSSMLKALGAGDVGGAAAEAVPLGFAIFGGPRAKVNPKIFEMAEAYERQGIHPKTILRETGVSRNADGMQQFEISDAAARFTPEAKHFIGLRDPRLAIHREDIKLPMILDHPALLKAYPEAANLRVVMTHKGPKEVGGGGYAPSQNVIVADVGKGGAPDTMKTMLHELNHFVAGIEGFDPGASPRNYIGNPYFDIKSMAKDIATSKGFDWDKMPFEMQADLISQLAHSAYKQNRGETASRNVERRRDWTAKRRKEVLPEETEDVPRSLQIPAASRLPVPDWPKE